MPKLRTVVFPVAGLGTRFLPATKVIPKEMLPIIDRPLIQWAADEAVAAGATKLVFVVNRHKRAISDHFDCAFELEQKLKLSGREELYRLVHEVLPPGVEPVFVLQSEARGLGHAVLCARPAIAEQSFGVILPDDFILNRGGAPALAQMAAMHERLGASVIAVEPVDWKDTGKYGIVSGRQESEALMRIDSMVEKPRPDVAPSNLAIVGRYVLSARIFDLLASTRPGAGGEIQLTDAICALLDSEAVYAYRFEGTRYDCGSKFGLIDATLRLALDDPEIGQRVRARMAELVQADVSADNL